MPAKQSEAWCKKAHVWTPEEIELLTVLWSGYLTQAEIGKRFGVGKNSIHGIAKRINLPPRMHLVAQRNPANCRRFNRAGFERMLPAILAVDRNVREKNNCPTIMSCGDRRETDPKPIKYSREGCRWVLELKPTRYCEAPALFNKSYCEAHHSVAVRKDPNDGQKRHYVQGVLLDVG